MLHIVSSGLAGVRTGCASVCIAIGMVTLAGTGIASSQDIQVGDTFEYTVPPGLETPECLQFEMPFQRGPKCGPNAIFVILQIVGVDCSYADVLEAVPTPEGGANLQELVKCAEKFGLECEARKDVSPQEVAALPMPVILHLKSASIKKDGSGHWDHFAVIAGPDPASDKGYIGVDTGNGSLTQFEKTALARNMSGYALVITDRSRAVRFPGVVSRLLSKVVWGTAAILIVANIVAFILVNRISLRRFA